VGCWPGTANRLGWTIPSRLNSTSINRVKRLAIVDGIKYQRIGDETYYAEELFETEELTGYLKSMLDVTKSVHEYVIYDSSGVERTFAEQLEKNEDR
jgi:type III restriction enzyme